VAVCGNRWFVAGGLLSASGDTAPALWSSTDGHTFAPMRINTVGAYGPEDILSTVACSGATEVAVGAKSGGAHGNPRTSTWVATGNGPLTEVPAGFELYGGEAQIGLGPVAGGGAGFLLVGARVDASGGPGAAVWHSPDGSEFTLVDNDPALESDGRGSTEVDAAAVSSSGFVAVGGLTPPHNPQVARDPIAWRSADGLRWSRITFPSTPADDLLQQVALLPDGSALAAGTDNGSFGVWRSDASLAQWREVAKFGRAGTATAAPPDVTALVVAGGASTSADPDVFVVVSDGGRYQMLSLPLGAVGHAPWRQVDLPVQVSATPVASGPRVVSVARTSGGLLLGLDDGARATVWAADLP
jgi:hypothetical protein